MGHADKIASDARRELAAIIDPPLNKLLDEIRASQDQILNTESTRTSAAGELQEIATEADRLLSLSADVAPAQGEGDTVE